MAVKLIKEITEEKAFHQLRCESQRSEFHTALTQFISFSDQGEKSPFDALFDYKTDRRYIYTLSFIIHRKELPALKSSEREYIYSFTL